jgi:hypothetical protein
MHYTAMNNAPPPKSITVYLSSDVLAKLDARVKKEADRTGLNASRTAVAAHLIARALGAK